MLAFAISGKMRSLLNVVVSEILSISIRSFDTSS